MTALDLIKSSFTSKASLILIMHDAAAKKVLTAWTLCPQRCYDFEVNHSDKPETVFAKLWLEADPVDFDRLAAVSGIPIAMTRHVFFRMQAARLLWPDGTISDGAMGIITTEVGSYIRHLIPRGGHEAQGRTHAGGSGADQPDAKGLHKGPAAEPRTNKVRQRRPDRHHHASRVGHRKNAA